MKFIKIITEINIDGRCTVITYSNLPETEIIKLRNSICKCKKITILKNKD